MTSEVVGTLVTRSFLGRPALAIAAALLIVACGYPKSSPSAASASSSRTASSARLETPSSLWSPTPGYKAYVNSTSRYSLEYPATWFHYPEYQDATHSAADFTSHKIASPAQIDASGIWLNIIIDTAPATCSLGDPGGANVTAFEVSIDGVTSTAWIVVAGDPNFRGGERLVGVPGPLVMHNGWCYSFGFLTRTVDSTQSHMAEIQHIYSSFRFNR